MHFVPGLLESTEQSFYGSESRQQVLDQPVYLVTTQHTRLFPRLHPCVCDGHAMGMGV